MVKVICIIFCFLFWSFVDAQNWKNLSYANFTKEYQELLAALPQENYRVSIDSKYFINASDKTPIESEHASLAVFSGTNYIYHTGKTTQIQLSSVKIDIDSLNQKVYVSKPLKSAGLATLSETFTMLDSLNYQIKKTVKNDLVYYEIKELKQVSQIHKTVLCFHAKKGSLISVEMNYWPMNYEVNSVNDESLEEPRVVMNYSSFITLKSEEITPEIEAQKWVIISNGKEIDVQLVEQKKEYLLTDLR